jgi:hypothetical protein
MGLDWPGLYLKAIIRGQVWLYQVVTWLSRFPYVAQRNTPVCNTTSICWVNLLYNISQFLRKLFWNHIIQGKDGLNGGTAFDFKYQPNFGQITDVEFSTQPRGRYPGIETIELFCYIARCAFYTLTLLALGRVLLAGLYFLRLSWSFSSYLFTPTPRMKLRIFDRYQSSGESWRKVSL